MRLYPYKIQMCQTLKEGDNVQRQRDFANYMVEKLEKGSIMNTRPSSAIRPFFSWMVMWIRKTGTTGISKTLILVSSCHYTHKGSQLSSKWIIGSIFIDGMVTRVKYWDFLVHHFSPETGHLNMTSRHCFMQDEACLHRTADVFKWLEIMFSECLIALDAEKLTGHGIEWPPYSPDLSPGIFMSYFKDRICRNPPDSLKIWNWPSKERLMHMIPTCSSTLW